MRPINYSERAKQSLLRAKWQAKLHLLLHLWLQTLHSNVFFVAMAARVDGVKDVVGEEGVTELAV